MRGSLGLLPALAGPLFRIAVDRLAGDRRPREDGVPAKAEAVDADWLTAALQERAPGAVVTRVDSLGGHSGTTTRERLRLTTDVGGHSAGLPETLFLKITPAQFGPRVFTTLLGLGASEVSFYHTLGEAFPVRIPRVYCARQEPRVGRFVLLLEDLEASGCRFPRFTDPLDLEGARAVVTVLARLHAAFWESPRLRGELAWLRSPENDPQRGLAWWISARSNRPALASFGDVVPEAVRARTHRIHERRALLELHWARAARTLIHGDPHAGNLFFDGDEAGLFDWQVVQAGPGLRDVSYFLVNSLDTSVRRAHERELLEHYREILAAHGVAAPVSAEIWEEYRLFALYTWIAVSVTAAAAGLQSREVVRRAVERTGLALADLDSFGALDRLEAQGSTR